MPVTAVAGDGTIRRSFRPRAGSYIVILSDNVEDAIEVILDDFVKAHGVKKIYTYKYSTKGFAFQMTEQQAKAISREPRVKFVEEDGLVIAEGTTSRWNLDRTDNHMAPRLDGGYTYCTTGKGVRAYVVDTGIWAGHSEFSNLDPDTLASRVPLGWDYENARFGTPNRSNNPCSDPANGTKPNDPGGSHGTSVASVLGGRTMGSAPEVTLVPVRTLDCGGRGATSDLIAGLDWIPTDPARFNTINDPASGVRGRVVNMSHVTLDCGAGTTANALENSVRGLLNPGITVVAAAGNFNEPIGTRYSPARMPEIITVAGSKGKALGDVDSRSNDGPANSPAGCDVCTSGCSFGNPGSNYGSVVDIFAPADRVTVGDWTPAGTPTTVTWVTPDPNATRDDNNNRFSSGTSFAAPLVAGVAARWLQIYPTESCSQIESRLIAGATTEVHGLDLVDRMDAPNRLLYKGLERCIRPGGY